MTLLVMAKDPVPGLVKTRLCPPCSPEQAAAVAAASLEDTLSAAVSAGAGRVVLAMDDRSGKWARDGVELITQRGGDFTERLANTWDAVDGSVVQIGMDTPQASAVMLRQSMVTLGQPGTDAVLGPADDGGWWLLGMRRPDKRVFDRIHMSTPKTGALQLGRLRSLGLRTLVMSSLRDIDTFTDARLVAREFPGSATAQVVEELEQAIGLTSPRRALRTEHR